ncbi:hypothetical protein PHMEG_00031190 [Phytophthora megakarya]|uniref:PiggyBac transposable element-derived protein domain-containing protein n=1 Tax=Phytophthora megakarya TaxID=4795 RepID=A0A225UYM7_9STRA|nr:hypothetical protein PHMEG_00031190 [Phytophthora megakarya]
MPHAFGLTLHRKAIDVTRSPSRWERKSSDHTTWKVLRLMTLFITRILILMHKGIAAHWSTKQLPTNKLDLFMAKDKFVHLHFSNNKSTNAAVDRAWKARPAVDVLQRTFAREYRAPLVISFDEAALQSPHATIWPDSLAKAKNIVR